MSVLAIRAARARVRAAIPAVAVLVCTLSRPAPARAQDFAPAAPAGPSPGAAALLERALPALTERAAFEVATIRWLGAPELETRSAALLVPVRSLRVACGLAQTGEPDVGWTTVALAAGAAGEGAGFAVRAAARRDRAGGALLASTLAVGTGAEAGAGAWLVPAAGVTLWAQAPQLWRSGEAPPLERPLELGVRATAGAASAWLALAAPRAHDAGERVAGLVLERGALAVWAEGRDGPLRAAVGVCAELRACALAVRVEGHPVLGETAQCALAVRFGAPRSAP